MSNEDIYILIDRYLAKELTDEEMQSFEERLKRDQDFAEKVRIYKSLENDLSMKFRHEVEKNKLSETLRQIVDEEIDSGGKNVISLNWYYWAAAASVAILVVFLFYPSSQPEYADFAMHEPLTLTVRGSQDSTTAQAERFFNNGNYKGAVASLEALIDADSLNYELHLYKAISLLELNRFADAESMLNQLKVSGSIYKDQAQWYLALSALKQKQFDRCKTILQQIPPEAETFDKAQQLLDKLD